MKTLNKSLIAVLAAVSLTSSAFYEDDVLHVELDHDASFEDNLLHVLDNLNVDYPDRHVDLTSLHTNDTVQALLENRKADTIEELPNIAFNLLHDGCETKTLYWFIVESVNRLEK